MAELGALSLKIEAIGDKQVLAALNAIETKARVVDKTTTDAVAALKSLGIAAKAVGNQVAVAAGEMEKASAILKGMGNTARLVSKENVEAAKVEANANRVRHRGFQEYLGLLTQGARFEKSRADAIRQLVALEGALQKQLQATNLSFAQQVRIGETLARVQSAIAGGIESTAVVTAQASGKISAFGRSGLNAFNAVSFGVSQLAATGQVGFKSLATSTASVLSFFGAGGAIAAAVVSTGLVLADFWQRQKKDISETTRLIDGLVEAGQRRDPVSVIERELATVRESIKTNRQNFAAAFDISARTDASGFLHPVDQKRLTEISTERLRLLQAEVELIRRLGEENAKTGESAKDAEKERQQAIATEINSLGTLARVRGLSGVEVVRLAQLERQLTAELKAGQTTKEREAEIWEQITRARATGEIAIPRLGVRDLVSGRPQAASRLAAPLGAAFDPATIQADIQAADAAMAARVAAFNFHETEQALSQSLGNAVASAIAGGFAQGLGSGGIGEGFAQMAGQLASGLGSVAIDYGLKAKAVATLMSKVSAWLIANPVLAIGGGIALVALGQAIGGRRGGGGGSSFGGGGSFSAASPTATSFERLIIDPNAGVRSRVAAASAVGRTVSAPEYRVYNVIGHTSPQGQEMIGESYDMLQARRT